MKKKNALPRGVRQHLNADIKHLEKKASEAWAWVTLTESGQAMHESEFSEDQAGSVGCRIVLS